ncbi:MAG: riboflavin synthase [Clostridiales bacterium]|nr:riboflavin synthase [Clostridiales bacterium]MCF8022563.1 riboflavin synthase [Clostridiales bacterium]
MFTGLVEKLGTVRFISKGADSARLTIEAGEFLKDLKIGDSVAVNGVCLTASACEKAFFDADVMTETLSKSNLGKLKVGDPVNLEKALRIGDRLGGHLVSGHIDGVGNILQKKEYDISILLTISAGSEVMKYIISKGSVAVDGTSLTVVDFAENNFIISIIPHTSSATILGKKSEGDSVNLEGDLIGKYIERLLGYREENKYQGNSGVTMQALLENGFL